MCDATGSAIDRILALLPRDVSEAVRKQPQLGLEEVRLRLNRPIQLIYAHGERLLEIAPDERDCERMLECLCAHSLYAWEEELKNCFITLPGGCRVGMCGRMRINEGHLSGLNRITSFNIRIAHEYKGCAAQIAGRLADAEGRPLPTLLISPPGAGKTTMLRDIARSFSNGLYGLKPRKVCIADERSEIAGAYNGVYTLDVGRRTDVMDGCSKTDAMARLIRTMSPEVLVTDEIGTEADAMAVLDACASGVAVIASAHGDAGGLMQRPAICRLIAEGCFANVFSLYRNAGRVEIKQIRREGLVSDI